MKGQSPNDAFTSAADLGSGDAWTVEGSTINATFEEEEPNHGTRSDPEASVWYRWLAPSEGVLTLTLNSIESFQLAAYESGSLEALKAVNEAQDQMRFKVFSGKSYHFAIASRFLADTGPFSFTGELSTAILNDDFDQATDLGNQSEWSATTNFAGTSLQVAEPGSLRETSAWYRWTPQESLAVHLTITDEVTWDKTIRVFTGATLEQLKSVGWGASVSFVAEAGTTYHIAFTAEFSLVGEGAMQFRSRPMALNDTFAQRETLPSEDEIQLPFSYLGSDTTSDEPREVRQDHAASVWWEWQVPASGRYLLGHDVYLYRGNELDDLQWVSTDDGVVELEKDEMVQVAAAASFARWETFLTISRLVPPENDSFSQAYDMGNVTSFQEEGSNGGATREEGEPFMGKHQYGDATVWWSWTAPYSSPVSLFAVERNLGQFKQLTVSVFTGETVAGLRAQPPIRSISTRSTSFLAESGTTYHFSVAGDWRQFDQGDFTLVLRMNPAMHPYDFLANPQDLGSGSEVTTSINLNGSTFEIGEASGDPEWEGSVWCRWTAPKSGWFRFSVGGTPVRVTVYRGDQADDLVVEAEKLRAANWHAEAGQVYTISIQGRRSFAAADWFRPSNPQQATLSALAAGLGNESLAQAISLGNASHGEVMAGKLGMSAPIWWQWQAPSSGLWYLGRQGDSIMMSVYQFDETLIASGSRSVFFQAEAGETYAFAFGTAEQTDRVFTFSWAPASEMSNDAFAEAHILSGDTVEVNLPYEGATLEPDESPLVDVPSGNIEAKGGSVWWEWTAPSDGNVSVSLSGSDLGVLVSVLIGDRLRSLRKLAGKQSKTEFEADSGVTYRIAVASRDADATGRINLLLQHEEILQPEPEPLVVQNDAFEDRLPLHSLVEISWGGQVSQSTLEPGEPTLDDPMGSRGSVWWSWVCPESGVYGLREGQFQESIKMAVYTGSSLGELQRLPTTTLRTSIFGSGAVKLFQAEKGESYQLAYPSNPNEMVSFSISSLPGNSNDAFADRIDLGTGMEADLSGANINASMEPDEPAHDPNHPNLGTLWWQWTALRSGDLTIKPGGNVVLDDERTGTSAYAIYEGDTLADLVPLIAGTMPDTFPVQVGQTYSIALYGAGGARGILQASLSWDGSVANDLFAKRESLPSLESIRFGGTTVGTTIDPYEADLLLSPKAKHSLWWEWTAPQTGTYLWRVRSGESRTRRAIFRGQSLFALKLAFPWKQDDAPLIFSANAGETFQLTADALDTDATGPVDFQLYLQQEETPPQDYLSALPLVDGVAYNHLWSGYSWWKWTGPRDGWFRLDAVAEDSIGAPDIELFLPGSTGTASTAFEFFPSSTSGYMFFTSEGQEYFFRATGLSQGTLSLTSGPPNDLFAMRIDLPAEADLTRNLDLTELPLTSELGEPYHGGRVPKHTLWYQWQAPASTLQTLSVDHEASMVAVYQGDVVSQLANVAAGNGSVQFQARAGQFYQIAIDMDMSSPDLQTLSIRSDQATPSAFDIWMMQFPGLSADLLADPDGDDLSNLMEFALGLVPNRVDPSPFALSSVDGSIVLTYRRPSGHGDLVNYVYEVSEDLVDWQAGAFKEEIMPEESREQVHIHIPTLGQDRYLRLRVEMK